MTLPDVKSETLAVEATNPDPPEISAPPLASIAPVNVDAADTVRLVIPALVRVVTPTDLRSLTLLIPNTSNPVVVVTPDIFWLTAVTSSYVKSPVTFKLPLAVILLKYEVPVVSIPPTLTLTFTVLPIATKVFPVPIKFKLVIPTPICDPAD